MNSLASANTAIIEDGKKVMSIAEGNEVHTYDPIQPLYVSSHCIFTAVGSDADYVSVSRLLTFSPVAGVSTQAITVPITINGDSDFEGNEMFTCQLSSPQPNIMLSQAVVSVTITNDDG